MLRLVLISDTHGGHSKIKIPDGDILIHAGDFTYFGKTLNQLKESDFSSWLAGLPHPYKIVIAGNHEEVLDSGKNHLTATQAKAFLFSRPGWNSAPTGDDPLSPGCFYLENQALTVMGIKIYGAPQQPAFSDMAFNLYDAHELREVWKAIPDDVQLLVTHGPPFGVLDDVNQSRFNPLYQGCQELAARVRQLQNVKLHVFGHIHEGYGVSDTERLSPGVVFANASVAGTMHETANPPIIIDVPDDPEKPWKIVRKV